MAEIRSKGWTGDRVKVPGYVKSKRLGTFLKEQEGAQVSWDIEYKGESLS